MIYHLSLVKDVKQEVNTTILDFADIQCTCLFFLIIKMSKIEGELKRVGG